MAQKSHFIEANGKRLECAWFGTGGRSSGRLSPTALVFLHEGLGCVAMWRDVPETLAQITALPSFVYSRVGFGASDPISLPRPSDFHSIEAYDVLPAVLDTVGIEQAVIVGHSDGGTIGLMAAGRDLRIKGVVSIAAHVFNEEITRAGTQAGRSAWKTTDLREKLHRYHGDNVDNAFFGWNDTWLRDDFRDWNVEACLKEIRCPVLIVQGEDDQYGSKRQVDAIASQVSGPSEVMIIPDCGHSPHQEAAEPLFSRINDFVGRLAL